MDWKILRRMRAGVRFSAAEDATNLARSRAFHSHSRLPRKSNADGKVSLLTVVSIWKIFGPCFFMISPMRQLLLCSSLLCWSMNERLFSMVCVLW